MTETAYRQEAEAEASLIEVVYYTDPLCCWSWAMEPQWRRLRYTFGEHLKWRYVMGGLIPDWQTYNDPVHSISRPLQMGPLWFEARHISGVPINDRIWFEDPPASSYPGCVAVKCAALQSSQAEEIYLRAVREAVMVQGRNVARQDVLLDIATQLEAHTSGVLNAARFKEDFLKGRGNAAFKEDVKETRYHKIGRFPTLTIHKPGGKTAIITGFRPYEILRDAVAAVAPGIKRHEGTVAEEDFLQYWKGATEQESAWANQNEKETTDL